MLEPSGLERPARPAGDRQSHLLELRYYDDVLDGELNRVWRRSVERPEQSLFRQPVEGLPARADAHPHRAVGFIERVENSLRIVGDGTWVCVYPGENQQLGRPLAGQVTCKQRLLERRYLPQVRGGPDRALTLAG